MTTIDTAGAADRSTALRRGRQFHLLRIAEVHQLCDDAVAVTFDVPPELAADYAFLPGQSLALRRTVDGRDERRSYSICAAAGQRPRVGVREVPGGLFSSWLVHDVRPGDEIEVQPPPAASPPDVAVPGRHVLIAAGSGITPVLSIVSSLLLRNPSTLVTLFYGNRRTNSVMFAEELSDLKDTYGPRLELVHVLSREPREVALFTGRLDADRIRLLLDALVPVAQVDHFWLCGPFGMVNDAQDVLHAAGASRHQVHQELFYVDDLPPEPVRHEERTLEGPSSEVTVILDGRSTTLTLPRDVPVLDSAQHIRADLPFACKGGVCGTCRAQVTCGAVRMRRNYALEKSEVDAGFVLTCQSLPVTDEVTVDYDV